MSRFNSTDYLARWRETGQFPDIHNDIFAAVMQVQDPGPVLDLCCSTGLLTQRLMQAGLEVYGVDGSKQAISDGLRHGIRAELHHHRITPGNLWPFRTLLRTWDIRSIVARRCLPELFGTDLTALEHGAAFADMLRSCGVRHILLEGRVPVQNAVNSLASVESEVLLFAQRYRVAAQWGRVVHLEQL